MWSTSSPSVVGSPTIVAPVFLRRRLLALPDARLEVYRDPTPDGYRTVQIRRAGETIAPLARPAATIAVADLLP